MNNTSRRKFLKTSGVLLTSAFAGSAFDFKMKTPLLSFSTLGCPDWSFTKIVDFAAEHAYHGLEIRGLKREMDLVKCPEFNSPGNRNATLKLMSEKNLQFVGLGSSATLHFADKTVRQKNIDEGKSFIELAHQINCPYVRVFPNNFPKEQDNEKTMELISSGLLELAGHAKGTKVTVLMETHGDLVKSPDLLKIMKNAAHPQVGLVWDISNMWTITGEAPREVYNNLKPFIRHTHIKDAIKVNGKLQYTFVGKGDVPVFEAIDLLAKDGYTGYFSFEWEKLWHPEIAEPEIALADYPVVMNKHFTKT